jgi:hypothetical protein
LSIQGSSQEPDKRDLVTYSDIATAQGKSFDEKVQWFQDTCARLRVDWSEGHMRMNVRRQYLFRDSMDAVMSLSREDLRRYGGSNLLEKWLSTRVV